jgi:hypothetical protein
MQHSKSTETSVEIIYDINSDPKACKSPIINGLTRIHKNVKEVKLDWGERRIETGEYINVLLASKHVNIKGLKVIGGHFNEYSSRTTCQIELIVSSS